MSLKRIPGSGKSGTSAISASAASRPGRAQSRPGHFLPRLDFGCRVGCCRPADAALLHRTPRLGRDPAAAGRLGRPGRRGRRRARHRAPSSRSPSASSAARLVADRHVLGERRAPRRSGRPRALRAGLGALVGQLDLGLAATSSAPARGGAMKTDEKTPAAMPTNCASARSFSELGAELDGADVEDRADRDQRHDRGVDRADQGLVDGQVGGLGVASAGSTRRFVGVLPDLVEDDDRVVHREAEDREQAGHGRRRDREAGQRVDADRDERCRGPARRARPRTSSTRGSRPR